MVNSEGEFWKGIPDGNSEGEFQREFPLGFSEFQQNWSIIIFESQIWPTSRLNFQTLKEVLKTRHLGEKDNKIKTRWYMTYGWLPKPQTKKSFSKKNPPAKYKP